MPVNKLYICVLSTALCSIAAVSNAKSSLFGDDLKDSETVVLQLQTQLNELGFDAGPTDGAWGRRTAGAVDAFIERFPPATPFSEASDLIYRLQVIHDSRFGSPFGPNSDLITPPSALISNQVFRSDIRDQALSCNDCSVVTFALGSGDFDGDGVDELVVGQHLVDQNRIAVNEATRTLIIKFDAHGENRELVLAGEAPHVSRVHEREAVIADFNLDGVDDLFIAATGVDGPVFYGEQNVLILSSPNGPIDVSFVNLPIIDDNAHGADAGDIDGDGDIDIVVSTHSGTGEYDSYVLWNDGTGNFRRQILLDLVDDPSLLRLYVNGRVANQYSTMKLADLNGDRFPELLLLSCGQSPESMAQNYNSYALINDQNGAFLAEDKIVFTTDRWGNYTFSNDADVHDLDGNGLVDVILTQSTATDKWNGHYLQIFMQEEPDLFVDRTAERLWAQGYQIPLELIAHADQSTLMDLDGDGDSDLITTSAAPAMRSSNLNQAIVQIGINDGSGTFSPLDPRWVSHEGGFSFIGPIVGRFGPNGEPMIASHRIFGSYTAERNVTYGVNFYLHRPG
ncbi:hypothetical protein LSUCC1028_09985 [Rhodobacterales bacterium LSUCC1028]|nr:hypothetical protein [Rhodobacterales bacterium LSUCC1028]